LPHPHFACPDRTGGCGARREEPALGQGSIYPGLLHRPKATETPRNERDLPLPERRMQHFLDNFSRPVRFSGANWGREAGESVRCRGSVTPLTHKSHIRSYAVQGFARGNRLKDHDKDFLVEPRVDITPRCFPQRRTRHKPGSPTSHGSTYIEIHISPPCSNPRSAPPPRRGVFCCEGS
jgi:hypothetical protein